MDQKKEQLFISLANLKSSEKTLEHDILPVLRIISRDSSLSDFCVNGDTITFTSFRNLQRNIRFCCRTLFFLYAVQAAHPFYFPRPDYATLEFRQMKVLNLINSKIRHCSPMLHRRVLPKSAQPARSGGLFMKSSEIDEYHIQSHHNYPDQVSIPLDSLAYLSMAQFLEKPDDYRIVRCAYKKCTNYFITHNTNDYTCLEFPFGETCLNLLKKQTSVEHLGAKIRK